MKSTWPPPQVILVGLELNQHGHAASHEQASSSWPVIFHGVLSFGSFAARTGATWMRRPATSAHAKRDLVFITPEFYGYAWRGQIDFALRKVPADECPSRTRLQVLLKGDSRLFVRKCKIDDKNPRAKLSRMWRMALVVILSHCRRSRVDPTYGCFG